jgi:hypothetical protein
MFRFPKAPNRKKTWAVGQVGSKRDRVISLPDALQIRSCRLYYTDTLASRSVLMRHNTTTVVLCPAGRLAWRFGTESGGMLYLMR